MIGQINSLILVVGCQRSGTTLTGQIVGAHERAILVDEFDGLYPWFTAMSQHTADRDAKTAFIIAKSASKYRNPVARFLTSDKSVGLADAVDTLVLKSPNLTYSYNSLAGLRIPIKVIYPVRDPRAVVASMLRNTQVDFVENQAARIRSAPDIGRLFPDEVRVIEDTSAPNWLRATHVWKVKTGLASHFQNAGFPVMQFRYEDLVQDPEHCIDQIARFCSLEGSETIFAHERVYVGEGPGGTDRTRPVDRVSEHAWSDTLDTTTARDVLAHAQPLACQLGYRDHQDG